MPRVSPRIFLGSIFVFLLISRLCHLDIVWVEEGYPAAAALQLLQGKQLYSQIWFDKPPLSPYFYLLWGAEAGFPLRIAGAAYLFLCCLLAYRFAKNLWNEPEARAAAAFLAFYLTFGIPSAVMALAPDLLMVAPHLAAVYLAWKRNPLAAGFTAGLALLFNSKAIFVLAACLLFAGPTWPLMVLGFVLPNAAAAVIFGRPYLHQVWIWGAAYSAHGFPPINGLTRTLAWLGFQSAAVLATAVHFRNRRDWRMASWILLSLIAVAAGLRFFPRYYFQLLVPVALIAARGFIQATPKLRLAILILALIPLVRFAPRYVTLAADQLRHRPHAWSDLQMSQDTEAAAALLKMKNEPGIPTLLVWGYRPDLYALTRLPAATRFLDSQPLTGVLADRHLTSSEVTYPALAAANRRELIQTHPTFIVDGLGPFNAALAIARYPDLVPWLAGYHEIARTKLSIIYRANTPDASPKTP